MSHSFKGSSNKRLFSTGELLSMVIDSDKKFYFVNLKKTT